MLPAILRVNRLHRTASPRAEKEVHARREWRHIFIVLFIGLVVATGSGFLGVALWPLRQHPSSFPLLFVVAGILLGYIRIEAYGNSVNLGIIPVIAAGYLYGPGGGAFVGFAVGLGIVVRAGGINRKSVFNIGQLVISGAAAALSASPLVRNESNIPMLVLYGLVASSALYIVNYSQLCAVIALDGGINPWKVWRERFSWVLPQSIVLGQVAVGIVPAYRAAGLYELVAFALPVAGMQLAWRQYIAHTTRSVEDLRGKNADLIQLAARLQVANEAVLSTYRDTLEALVCALDARDNEVQGHSYRVSAYSQVLAERMGIERGSPEWEAIARGALLHDIGKIGVRDAVLRKPDKLDEAEWVEMREHSSIGFGILRDVEFLRPAAELVAAHHERFDGAGYPNGLKGEEIPLGARIFSVADTFDAITTDRPYRRAAPPEAAVAEIKRCSGTQFDSNVVAVFEETWQELWALREVAMQMVA